MTAFSISDYLCDRFHMSEQMSDTFPPTPFSMGVYIIIIFEADCSIVNLLFQQMNILKYKNHNTFLNFPLCWVFDHFNIISAALMLMPHACKAICHIFSAMI